jgi:membrane-bound ClpP family serine protease
VVQVAAEEWTAEAVRGAPRRGDRVRVVAMEGLKLKVEPVEEAAEASAPTSATLDERPTEGRQT